MSDHFYVFPHGSYRGGIQCCKAYDEPLRFLPGDVRPIYTCRLPEELRGRSLDELRDWYRMGIELGGLPA